MLKNSKMGYSNVWIMVLLGLTIGCSPQKESDLNVAQEVEPKNELKPEKNTPPSSNNALRVPGLKSPTSLEESMEEINGRFKKLKGAVRSPSIYHIEYADELLALMNWTKAQGFKPIPDSDWDKAINALRRFSLGIRNKDLMHVRNGFKALAASCTSCHDVHRPKKKKRKKYQR